MNDFVAGFAHGFVGAFKLAAALVVGACVGSYRFLARIGDQFVRDEPLR